MSVNKNCLIYVTVKNKKEGIYISKLVIEKKLAACANLFPKIQSIFQWKNDIQIENEAVLIFKTSEKKYKDLEQFILKIHSYETPCILKLKIDKGQKTFFEWIEKTLN
tara:strand:- start:40 stop:363 length:324 start_codon:yes stop_codon:yes gene_type:complete